jgi:hypothetical protein
MKKVNLLLCAMVFAASVHAQTSNDEGDIHWTVDNDVLTISGTGDMSNYDISEDNHSPWYEWRDVITSAHIGEGITSIGKFTFHNFGKLTSVTISNTVTTITANSFLQCRSLTSISIPASVTSIHTMFVQACFALTEILVDAGNLTYVSGDGVLFSRDMKTLVVWPPGRKGTYAVPGTVETIDENAFYYSSLTSVTIPVSVTRIGDSAFGSCHEMAEFINLSTTPQTLGPNVFRYVDLTNRLLFVPSTSVDAYMSAAVWDEFPNILAFDEDIAFADDIFFLSVGATRDIPLKVNGKIGNPALINWIVGDQYIATTAPEGKILGNSPGSVEIIAQIAGKSAMCTLRVHDSMSGNISTLSWELDNGVLTISGTGFMPNYGDRDYYPWSADRDCIGRVVLEQGVGNIGANAFMGYGELTSVVIPNSVINIGEWAFGNCRKLKNAGLPVSIITIGAFAFYNSGLTSVTIPPLVTELGLAAFSVCEGISAFGVDANNTAYVSVDGVLFNINKTTLVAYPFGKPGNRYDIPSNVAIIGSYAFDNCAQLTAVTIPASVTGIDEWAFNACFGLKSLTIPESVADIGIYAFYCCSGLTEIINHATTPQTINSWTTEGINYETCILRVPAASLDAYNDKPVWGMFENIVALDADPPETKLTLNMNEIYLLPGGTAKMTAIATGDLPDDVLVLWDFSVSGVATAVFDCTAAVFTPEGVTGEGLMIHQCEITVTAAGTGTTALNVSAYGKNRICTVTVIEPGKTTIEGSNAGTEDLRVNLYQDMTIYTE